VTRRSYGQLCPFAHALDLIGERWALLVVRELLLGAKRFSDLAEGLPGIGTNILSARLRELEAAGVIVRRRLPPPAGSRVYELTEWGRELEDVMMALGRWGAKSPAFGDSAAVVKPEWAVLALKALFPPEAVADVPSTIELRFGEDAYAIHVAHDGLDIRHTEATDPEVVISLDVMTLVGILRGALGPSQALKSGAVKLEGQRRAFERFIGHIVRPEAHPARAPQR
jgi:DNA-binding HxlR family transcriptional regulator